MNTTLKLLGIGVLATIGAIANPILTPLPSSSITGAPGTTIGWGYSLYNDNTSDWYVPDSISTPSFTIGIPNVLFDYPSVAPLTTVSQSYVTGLQGLLELAISSSANIGAVDLGTIYLYGSFWDSDPYTNSSATIVASAPTVSANVTSTVTAPATTPEPASIWLLVSACTVAVLVRVKLQRRGLSRT